VDIDNRVVGRLDPDFLAALAIAHELVGEEFTAAEPVPELAVFFCRDVGGIAENAMMLSLDLGKLIADSAAEVFVGGQDFAGGGKFDDGLRAGGGRQFAGIFHRLQFDGGDVGREFHDLIGLGSAEDRIVGRLDPDIVATLGDAAILHALELATGKPAPEFAILRACGLRRINKDAMMFSLDLGERIAQRRAEIRIGVEDVSVEVKFDDGLGLVHRGEDRARVSAKAGKMYAHCRLQRLTVVFPGVARSYSCGWQTA
jgi:hypothetical protein